MLEDDTKNKLMMHADITNTNIQTMQYKTPANYQTAALSLNRRQDRDHRASFSHFLPKCGLHSCWINTTLDRQLLHQWTTEFNPCKSLFAAVYILNKHLPISWQHAVFSAHQSKNWSSKYTIFPDTCCLLFNISMTITNFCTTSDIRWSHSHSQKLSKISNEVITCRLKAGLL